VIGFGGSVATSSPGNFDKWRSPLDQSVIQKIIATELAPKIVEYENEMAHIRDQLFGSLIKSIAA
jgi:hypothetical protein